ncbi:MAG: TetR/AcrR family transcriptional regulator [Terracidiphilus sp.]
MNSDIDNPADNFASHEPWKAFRVREQRSLDVKRDAVLQTAAQLYLEMGYRKTSMSLLAARLNVTKPALYYYFRNKEELLVECYRAGIESIEVALKGAIDYQGNGLEKVESYIRSYATAIVGYDFGRCVATLDDSELSDQTRRQVRNLKRRIDAAVRGYIEEGIADGSIAPCNSKMASFAIAGAINWIGTWYRPNGGLGAEEIVSEFTRLLIAGLHRCPPEGKAATKTVKRRAAGPSAAK